MLKKIALFQVLTDGKYPVSAGGFITEMQLGHLKDWKDWLESV
jgi:hypothetical protein